MRADEWLEELVQLYEYRVADLSAGESPRGDRQSFQNLREFLLFADGLDGAARRRLMQAERQFRELQRQGQVQFSSAPRPVLATAAPSSPSTAPDEGTRLPQVLEQLSHRLWEADARRWLFARLWATRSEPHLMPLRVLATVTENLRRRQRGQSSQGLMSLADALDGGLTDPSQVEALAGTLLPLLSAAGGRQGLLRALKELEEQARFARPAQGAGMEHDPRERPVAAHDGLAEQETGELLLTDAPAPGASLAPAWAAEQQLLAKTAEAIELLMQRWPERSPLHGAAHLLDPATASSDAALVALRLPAEHEESTLKLQWLGLQLQVQRSGSSHELSLSDGAAVRQVQLRRDLPAELRLWTFELSGQLIHAVLEEDVLLLRSEQAAPAALEVLANRARLCVYLTQAYQAYLNMRLARAAALALRGMPLEGYDLSPASAAAYASAAPAQLGQLATRALDTLLLLSQALPDWQRTEKLQGAAVALGLPPAEGQLLSNLLGSARQPEDVFDPATLRSGGFPIQRLFTLQELPEDPLQWEIGGEQVQLAAQYGAADEEAVLTASLNGQPGQLVEEVLAWPLRGASLALARHEDWLAKATVVQDLN